MDILILSIGRNGGRFDRAHGRAGAYDLSGACDLVG